jgi:hypothetical protein
MGRLTDFLGYVEERAAVMSSVESRLCGLQAKYESFFAEVTRVRENELAQLSAHILADRGKLEGWLSQALDRAQAQVETEFEERLLSVRRQLAELREQAEQCRQRSARQEEEVRKSNLSLDAAEEELKARSQKLLAAIDEYNRRIRELGKGFGFFSNLFRMRELARQRAALDREQADVAAHIDRLRRRWAEEESQQVAEEARLRKEWIDLRSKAAALQAKLEALEESRSELVVRSTLERVLFELVKEPPAAGPGAPACPRCPAANPEACSFCRICGQRLKPDRSDLEGSIHEIAELNLHHRRFAEGMRAGQQLIALVRGIKSGLEAFSRSVQSVLDSERRYPLPKLEIDVPPQSLAYGRRFDELRAYVQQDLSLHPREFAAKVQPLVSEVLTETNIRTYFETMGEELSRQAAAQW